MVVWVPDWPVVALSRDGDDPLEASLPIAIFARLSNLSASAVLPSERYLSAALEAFADYVVGRSA